jgi:hypothetical protein
MGGADGDADLKRSFPGLVVERVVISVVRATAITLPRCARTVAQFNPWCKDNSGSRASRSWRVNWGAETTLHFEDSVCQLPVEIPAARQSARICAQKRLH